MTHDKDQFSLLEYPHVAGSKGRAAYLRERVRQWFADGNSGTADECAAALNETILAIRPRVSELHNRGFLEQTGERRLSSAGRSSHVWRKTAMRAVGEIALTDVVEPLRLKI